MDALRTFAATMLAIAFGSAPAFGQNVVDTGRLQLEFETYAGGRGIRIKRLDLENGHSFAGAKFSPIWSLIWTWFMPVKLYSTGSSAVMILTSGVFSIWRLV